MKQKYGRGKMPCSGGEKKGNKRQKGKGCVGQGKERKMSGSLLVPVRAACPVSIGAMRLLCTLSLHINKPELELSFLTTKGYLINTT